MFCSCDIASFRTKFYVCAVKSEIFKNRKKRQREERAPDHKREGAATTPKDVPVVLVALEENSSEVQLNGLY